MKITEDQEKHLKKRARLLALWRYTGPFLLLSVAALGVWLYLDTPLLIDPGEVISKIESGTLERSSLEMMAILLPLAMLLLLFLLLVIIVTMYAAFSNERKCIEIINEMRHTNSDPGTAC